MMCPNCQTLVVPGTRHIVRRAGFLCAVEGSPAARLTTEQLEAACIEYCRIRHEQDGREHGPPFLHRAIAECFDAWRLAFASVGAKL